MAANDPSKRWRVRPRSELDLGAIDTARKAGAPGDKTATKAATEALRDELAELQTRLWAESQQALLVVLQAMDAGGKDGVIRKVFSGLNPQGIRVEGFNVPTEEELAHDFLWRVHRRTPRHGGIAIFNRSHYEDVLVGPTRSGAGRGPRRRDDDLGPQAPGRGRRPPLAAAVAVATGLRRRRPPPPASPPARPVRGSGRPLSPPRR